MLATNPTIDELHAKAEKLLVDLYREAGHAPDWTLGKTYASGAGPVFKVVHDDPLKNPCL